MGNFQAAIFRLHGADFARNPVEASDGFMFQAAPCDQLHADANAKKRFPLSNDRVLQCLNHGLNTTPAISESADTG